MSVNISVSGKTLKECHDQILALADEISGTKVEQQTAPAAVMAPNGNIIEASTKVMFPLTNQPQASESDEVDSRGVPWNKQVHSASKEKNADGRWRKRRGISDEMLELVENEMMGKTAQPPAPQVTIPPMPTTEVRAKLPEQTNVLEQAIIPPSPVPSFQSPVAAAVIPPNTYNLEMFRSGLIQILNTLLSEGKLDQSWVEGAKAQFGGKDVTQWHENETACAGLFEAFVSWKLINKL